MADIKDTKNASGAAQNLQQGSGNSRASDQALAKINRELEEKAVAERAKTLNLPYVEIAAFPLNPDILHVLPEEEARTGMLLPFFRSGKKLKIAVSEPEKAETKEILKKLEEKGYELQINLASKSGLQDAFRFYASDQYKLKIEPKNIVAETEIKYEKELENLAKLKDEIAKLPAEEALNLFHVSAIKAGASDIHYQPEEKICLVRFRVDGVLHPVFEIAKDVYEKLANQLKYKAQMKLNIATVPQDGRFQFVVNERKIDVRVSSLPTEYGEAFVCRILDSGKRFVGFEELGFTGKSLEILEKTSALTHGMVLVTGPTSSGKTTTMYMLLSQFNKPESKIITLEDPIEYHLNGITQSQVNEKRGYTFGAGLRSILRQDPDIVMIGEIRDLETAQVASQAALTGHILFSTLHTNSAVDAIPRLLTIGLLPFVVAPALSVVVAQRLVRKLCGCAKARKATKGETEFFEKILSEIKRVEPSCAAKIPEALKTAKGCEQCNFTGYRGQTVVSEVLDVSDEIEDAILKNKSAPEIFAIARGQGMLTLMEDAALKVINGVTSLSEIHRVINA